MATQTGSIDLTASNSVKLAAEAGWQSDLDSYYTKSEIDVTVNGINSTVSTKVGEDEVISSINQSSESVSINANKINLTGAVTISDLASDAQDATLNSNISVGGRNLLQQSWRETQSSVTKSGITYTCNADGSITLNGTSTEMHVFALAQSMTLSAGTYTLSGCPAGGGTSSYRLDILAVPLVSGTTESVADNGSGSTFETTGGTTGQVRIRVASGQTLSNLTFWPKLEKGNVATDWTPAPEDIEAYADESAYLSAKPNLAPLGSAEFSDVYNATTNPDGYWRATMSVWFTQLDDGWIHVHRDNSSGTSAVNSTSFRPSPSPTVVAGKVYTILTEIRNNASTGTGTNDLYLQQINNNQFWGNTSGVVIDDDHVTTTTTVSLLTCGQSYVRRSYRIADTDHLTSGTPSPEMFRYNFRVAAGSILDFDFRMSVYEGIYDGPYKPYSGTQLFATQTDASNAAKTATSYVTEITGQNGIMVHPSTDQTTGVQITDSVNIMQDGVSVAEYGETARVGAEDSTHSVWESGEFVFNDGTNDTMRLSAPESITETHVIPSSNVSYYAYIELEYPPASLISVEVDNTEYTYTPTMTPYGLKLWKHGGDGDGFDGETVTVTYKPSPAMYIYDGSGDDDSNIAARINANEVSLAKDVFSISTEYDLSSGSIVGGDVRIGDSEASRSEIMLRYSSDRSYLTFQTKGGNRTAAFVLDSGSTSYPDRVLELIYLDRINYADPYGGSDRQLGKPTRLTADGSYTAGTADTMGPAVTLTAGIWLIEGSWSFTNSSSNSKRLVVGLYRSSTGNAYTYRIHTTASSISAHRIEVSDTIVVSATSETVTLYGASNPASTAAATQYITGIKLA